MAVIRIEHLRAALALWEYCEQSARYIFGDALGDSVADTILTALRNESSGLTRKQISSDLFARNVKSERLTDALALLKARNLAVCERIETEGRPAELWRATAFEGGEA